MSNFNRSTHREFIRKLYRDGATANLRSAILDEIADIAFEAQERGSLIESASVEGKSTSFSMIAGWRPAKLLSLIDFARDRIDEATVTDAIKDIGGAKRIYGNFTSLVW